MRHALIGLLALSVAGPATSACRQALALALDVSGSVDATEYRLQLDGLASALRDDAVRAAFLQGGETNVRLMIFEWSGLFDQRILLDWVSIESPQSLSDIADLLNTTPSARAADDSTAISAALDYGTAALMRQECWQRTLDISGDGPANMGRHPGELDGILPDEVTVNALVIGPQSRANTTKNLQNVKTLEEYFRSFVIRGPGAFVEVASDYDDFAQAMRRKLVRELGGAILSMNGPAPAPH